MIEDVRSYSPHEQQDDITLIVAKCHSGKPQNQLGLPYDAHAG